MFLNAGGICRVSYCATMATAGLFMGCQHAAPTATLGDPAVFTTLHMVAADRAYSADARLAGDENGSALGLSTLGHMHRYFGSTEAEYKNNARRMDIFLDQTQRSQAFALVLAKALQLEIQFTDVGEIDPEFASSNAADASTAQPTILADGTVASKSKQDKTQKELKAAKTNVADLEKKVATANEQLNVVNTEINVKNNVILLKTPEKTAAEKKVAELDAKVKAAEGINAKIDAATKEKAKAEAAVTTQQGIIDDANSTPAEVAVATQARDEAAKKVAQQIDLLTELMSAKTSDDALVADKAELKSERDKASNAAAQVKAATDRKAQLEGDAAAYKSVADDLSKKLGEAKAELKKAEEAAESAKPATTPRVAALAKLLEPNDSPFDRLDRVNDWFTAYNTLILSAYGADSRALDVDALKQSFERSYSQQKSALDARARAYAEVVLLATRRLDGSLLEIALAKIYLNKVEAKYSVELARDLGAARAWLVERENDLGTVGSNKSVLSSLAETFSANIVPLPLPLQIDYTVPKPSELAAAVSDKKTDTSTIIGVISEAFTGMTSSQKQSETIAKLTEALEPQTTYEKEYRLITLLIPVSIDAGTRPNTLIGNALTIDKISCVDMWVRRDDMREALDHQIATYKQGWRDAVEESHAKKNEVAELQLRLDEVRRRVDSASDLALRDEVILVITDTAAAEARVEEYDNRVEQFIALLEEKGAGDIGPLVSTAVQAREQARSAFVGYEEEVTRLINELALIDIGQTEAQETQSDAIYTALGNKEKAERELSTKKREAKRVLTLLEDRGLADIGRQLEEAILISLESADQVHQGELKIDRLAGAIAETMVDEQTLDLLRDLPVQVKLAKAELAEIEDAIQDYKTKIAESIEEINQLWGGGLQQEARPGDVRVLSLHPRRSYDLEEQTLTQSFRTTTRFLAQAGFVKGAGKLDASSDEQQEEASRFLSRISKVGAWQDASRQRFGWTFAPSNLRVAPRNVFIRLVDFFAGEPGRRYTAEGNLETGTRLCSAILLVRSNIDSITFTVDDYTMDVDEAGNLEWEQLGLRGTETSKKQSGKPTSTLRVDLPEYDPMETLILTLPQPN